MSALLSRTGSSARSASRCSDATAEEVCRGLRPAGADLHRDAQTADLEEPSDRPPSEATAQARLLPRPKPGLVIPS